MSTTLSTPLIGRECIGRVIDERFTLLRWLGGTEQSSVFLTELEGDPATKAAIKLSAADEMDAEARMAQWELAGNLSHPHLMRLFDAGRCRLAGEDLLYVVTEYADEILSEILGERPLTAAETSEMLGPVVEALSFLHGRNLVHGHLKPSNIMVVNDLLKLSTDGLHSPGQLNSAFPARDPYVAPEASGRGNVSPAADVWSLGVVLVEAFTQGLPAGNGTRGREPVVPASIPAPFFELARKCLRVDPARRPAVSEIRDFFEPAQIAETAGAAARSRASGDPKAIAGLVLVVAAMSGALFIGSHHGLWPAAVHQSSAPASQAHQISAANSEGPAAKGPIVKGKVAYQAIPDVPEHISDTIVGHLRVGIGVQVDSSGSVADATIDSPGPSQYFANRALGAARKWKFSPAEMGGHAVASSWSLQFSFSQSGTTVTPTETSP